MNQELYKELVELASSDYELLEQWEEEYAEVLR